ncbi:MAG TPA: molybdopterin molybdenumtransferase MoeA, partial [Methylotenera sp.]|nr:molybdopterin molybdenumtransferase MoeA [Methylotenera sp.]
MTKPTSLSQVVANPSCLDDYDPNSMPVVKAREFIKQFLSPVVETETIALRESLGRILAREILS